jgi:hypothetical protein
MTNALTYTSPMSMARLLPAGLEEVHVSLLLVVHPLSPQFLRLF